MSEPDLSAPLLYELLGDYLTQKRVEKRMTQRQVAEAIGVVDSAVTHYELADNRVPLHRLVLWCQALDVEIGSVLNDVVHLMQEE